MERAHLPELIPGLVRTDQAHKLERCTPVLFFLDKKGKKIVAGMMSDLFAEG